MPLLRKSQFDKITVPADLRQDEEIFYCSLTGEIFRDYDEFFKRTILLNSLVWTCSSTGKSGLTYEEALTSERTVQDSLEKLPDYLERPILYISGLTMRGRLDDLVNDVTNFMKERYFVGEVVEIVHSGVKRFGTIIEVNYDHSVASASNNRLNSSNIDRNGSTNDEDYEGTLTIDLDNNEEETVVSSSTPDQASASTSKKRKIDEFGPPSDAFKYVVEVLKKKREEKRGSSPADRYSDALKRMAVFTFDGIIRRKVALTKTRCRLYLKNVCELENNRFFIVKPSVRSTFNLDQIQWEHLFAGPRPTFAQTPLTRKPYTRSGSPPSAPSSSSKSYKPPQLQREQNYASSGGSANQNQRRINEEQEAKLMLAWEKQQQIVAVLMTEAQRYDVAINPIIVKSAKAQPGTLINENLINDLREKLKKAREDEKDRIREERRKARELMAEWKKPRDDLECDDHRPMPLFEPISTPEFLSGDEFGECLTVLEFLSSFRDCLQLSESYPDGVSLTYLLDALMERDAQGAFTELTSLLLREIFLKQTEEDGDEANLEKKEELQQENSDLDRKSFRKFIEDATNFSESVRNMHGLSVRALPVDGYTLTEVIRMYFMSGGYYTGVSTARFRFHRRGGFKCWDDHAMMFRLKNHEIMLSLSKKSIFDLNPGEKLKILNVFCDQLLSFSALRTPLLQKTERLMTLRWEWRQLQLVEQKWDKECSTAKINLQLEIDDEKLSSMKNSHDTNRPKSETFETLQKLVSKDTKREKLKNFMENLDFSQLVSVEEIDESRRLQKEFVTDEENRFKQEIQQLQACCGLTLLGQDRAYRKYWLVSSCSAVFVEHDDSQDLLECETATAVDKIDQQDVDVAPQVLRRQLYVCTGVQGDCPVHSETKKRRFRWSLIYEAEIFDQLSSSLNRRGYRENDLYENLQFYKDFLIGEIFPGCEVEYFTRDKKNDTQTNPTGADDVDDQMEEAFHENLLEIEEKIYSGKLGALKVFSRDEWRAALEDGRYDPQNDLIYLNDGEKISLDVAADGNNVKQMRLALLQVASGVNSKCLKRPFASSSSSSTSNGDSAAPFTVVDTFYSWKKSLLTVLSWSQLHLHMETFEQHVSWQKSLLQMKCRQCKRKGDTATLVCCRVCDKPFHLACLKPALRKLPIVGSWTCVDCRRESDPQAVKQELSRNKSDWRQNSDLYDSELVNADQRDDPRCALCKKGLKKKGRLSCVRCSNLYHFDCANSKNPSKKNWLCNSCLADPDRSVVSSDAEENNSYTRVKVSRTGRTVKRPISFEELNFDRKISATSSPSNVGTPTKNLRKSTNFSNGSIIDDDDDVDAEPTTKKLRKKNNRSSLERRGGFNKFYQLLNSISRHSDAWPFLKPVSRKDAPDYYVHISKPMDLQTVRTKLDEGRYVDEKEFLADFRQMFENCRIYNETFCPVFRSGQNLEAYFDEKLNQLNFKTITNGVDSTINNSNDDSN